MNVHLATHIIASWVFGRIIADEKGRTTITLAYNGLVKNINVTVTDYMDTSLELSVCDVGNDNLGNEKSSVSSVTRQDAVDTASDMVNMTWAPEKNLYTWFGTDRDPFYAGSTYTGMPYTQYHLQTTKEEFLYAMKNNSDFYTRVRYGEYLVPKYGNDCSGFLSICWGLTGGSGRTRWNTTDFINAVDDGTFTALSYNQLQKGDALYKKSGGRHVIMVYKVELGSQYSGGGRVHVYEQTDIKARSSTFTFTDLENSGYTAFSMF